MCQLMELSAVFVPWWLMGALMEWPLPSLCLVCMLMSPLTEKWCTLVQICLIFFFCVLAGPGLCLCFSEPPVMLLARRNFTWRWECPCFSGAPSSKTGCRVVFQWICRLGTRGRRGPYLGIYGIAWVCLAFCGGFSVTEVCVWGHEGHTTGCWWASCRNFPRQLVGTLLKVEGRQTSLCPSCSCVCSWANLWGPLRTQPVQLYVLDELYLTWWIHLTLHFYVQASESHVNHQKQCFTVWTRFLVESYP